MKKNQTSQKQVKSAKAAKSSKPNVIEMKNSPVNSDATLETSKYDPSKAYRWNPEDTFTLTGQEFGFTYQVLNAKKMELLQQLEIIGILENKLKEAVESGVAVEHVEEAK